MKRLLRNKIWITLIALLSMMVGEASAQLNKSYFYMRGREYIISGRYNDAIESLNLLLRSQPKEYEGYFLRGVAKYNLNDLHGAMRDFTQAIEENPVYTQAFQYRGITRSRLGMYNEALDDFARTIEMRPNYAGAYYSRAVTFFLNQQFEQAIKDYNSFLRIEPRNGDGYVNRGTAKLYLKDTLSAIEDYNRAIMVNPYGADGYLRRGLVGLMQGRTDDGLKDMNSALSIDSTIAIGYFYRAMGNNTKGNIVDALGDFDKAIDLDPTNSVAIFNRAILRSQIGDYNRAIEDYMRVAEQNPDNVLVYYNRAAVYAQIGDYKNAIADYSRAIEIYGDFANAYLYRSNLKAQLGDRRGYESDRKRAEELIAQYRNRLSREGESAFADTSALYSSMINFNTDFEGENLTRLNSKTLSQFRPLPMYRLSIFASTDSVVGYDPRRFENEKIDQAIASMEIENLRLSNRQTDIPGWRLMDLDTLYAQIEDPKHLFARGIVQTLMRQYATAMNCYNFLASDDPTNAFVLLNRAVTDAEMTEFMTSLDGDYQNITANSDPVERLHRSKETRKVDFTSVITDLRRAAQLMPQLPHIYYNLGYMYAVVGDLPSAIASYSKAIELFPYFGEAYYNRALIQLSIDEKEKGALDLSRAGEIGVDEAYGVIDKLSK